MDKETVKEITEQVAQRFPEMEEIEPKIKQRPAPKNRVPKDPPHILLLYKTQGYGPEGEIFPRVVRVVATPQGKIIKMTTSKSLGNV